MGRRLIEVMQVLVDQVHKGGYQHRVLEDSIYEESQKRIAAEKDRDHWRQARQEAIEAGELMRAEIETLRTQLANAERAASDEFTERQVLTVEQQQDAAAWQQQVDSANAEVSYLRTRLDEERSVIAGLRTQLDAANAAETLQRARIERLHKFVGKARLAMWPEDLKSALAELDAGNSSALLTSSPTPVAEPLDAEGGACPGK